MPQNFFELQNAARQRTRLLVAYFAVAVLGTCAVAYLVVWFFYATLGDPVRSTSLWQPWIFFWIVVPIALILVGNTVWKLWELREGAPVIMRLLGARRIAPNSKNLAEQKLFNVVEEMAVASGIAVPPVYVLDKEQGINALAAGFTPDNAAIAVTTGAMHHLSRDELQAVIAHEFGHILSGDMRLNMYLIGVLHGLQGVGLFGSAIVLMDTGERPGRAALAPHPAFIAFGVLLVVVGFGGLALGRLIKSRISCTREFHADATAVQLTRNPRALTSGLKKIGGFSRGSKLWTARAEIASHMYFADGRFAGRSWYATHPPLAERLQRFERGFDGTFPRFDPPPVENNKVIDEEEYKQRREERARLLNTPGVYSSLHANEVVALIGNPGPQALEAAEDLITRLPQPIREAAHDPALAPALVYALMLDSDEPQTRRKQMEQVRTFADEQTGEETERLWRMVRMQGTVARLPLLDLCLPALRELDPSQRKDVRQVVHGLIVVNDEWSMFDVAVQWVLHRQIGEGEQQRTNRRVKLETLEEPLYRMLSLLARVRTPRALLGTPSYKAALDTLGMPHKPLNQIEGLTIQQLRKDLEALSRVRPKEKQRLMEAFAACVADNNRLLVKEVEILRAVAEALDCPLPMLEAAGLPAEEEQPQPSA